MPTLASVTEAHGRRQKALAQRTAARLTQLWAQIDPGAIARSWRALIPSALTVLSTSQATAAASAAAYIDDALEAQGVVDDIAGRVSTGAFAGIASDGRELDTLLYQPAIAALTSIQQGQPINRATVAGLMSLDVISRTQISDAGRAAESVAIAARPQITGYVRMLTLPSCARCIILAGIVYRWNTGFIRHPRCDCRHIPAAEDTGDDIRTEPMLAFRSMSEAEQNRVFGSAGAEAIRAGADINQVVNARRGIYTAGGRKYTRDSTTRLGATRGARRRRLMPEQIFIEAGDDRAEAIRLLKLHGYLR
jgi:hypothetical protein